jgi:hypothetical protein
MKRLLKNPLAKNATKKITLLIRLTNCVEREPPLASAKSSQLAVDKK